MNAVIEFYKELDPLNTIIFWGIIIVLLLLLVFTILMISKRKKQKHQTQQHNELFFDEITLPSNSIDTLIMKEENILVQNKEKDTVEPFVANKEEPVNEQVEVANNFKAEEYVMEYNNELFNLENVKKTSEQPKEEPQVTKESSEIKIPKKPYERNVLREMSLSQTSPIGIVKRDLKINKQIRRTFDDLEEETDELLNNSQQNEELSSNVEEPTKNIEQSNSLEEKQSLPSSEISQEQSSISLEQENLEEINKPEESEEPSVIEPTINAIDNNSVAEPTIQLSVQPNQQHERIEEKELPQEEPADNAFSPEPPILEQINEQPESIEIEEEKQSTTEMSKNTEQSSTELSFPSKQDEQPTLNNEQSNQTVEIADIPEEKQSLGISNELFSSETVPVIEEHQQEELPELEENSELELIEPVNEEVFVDLAQEQSSTNEIFEQNVEFEQPIVEITPNISGEVTEEPESKSENAQFLEEVSQKLATAETIDGIDRTEYELQQEEDAIISYKELMAKKDTIKTIDEEDAIISIKELTARKNNEEKSYNLTENEKNDEFLDELKKFRNDLQ